jgi:hypothetical protein
LQLGNGMADGRLGHVQLIGGAIETIEINYRVKHIPLLETDTRRPGFTRLNSARGRSGVMIDYMRDIRQNIQWFKQCHGVSHLHYPCRYLIEKSFKTSRAYAQYHWMICRTSRLDSACRQCIGTAKKNSGQLNPTAGIAPAEYKKRNSLLNIVFKLF